MYILKCNGFVVVYYEGYFNEGGGPKYEVTKQPTTQKDANFILSLIIYNVC